MAPYRRADLPTGKRRKTLQIYDRSGAVCALDVQNNASSKPYEFKGLGAVDVAKPYGLMWIGDSYGPKLPSV
jgi:hypothetical protein